MVMMPVPKLRLPLVALIVLGAVSSASAQGNSVWNRRVESLRVQPSATGPSGAFDLLVDWRLEAISSGSGANMGTEIALLVNATEVAMVTATASDPGLSAGGADPGACMPATCGGSCGSVSVDAISTALTCVDAATSCACQSPDLTAVFPGVVLTPGDEIMVLLRPAPGAAPDADPTDDGGPFIVDTWNRRVTSMLSSPGSATGLFDLKVWWTLDLESSSTLPLELGTTVELKVNGSTQTSSDNPECIIWDIADSCATVSGMTLELLCPGGPSCSLPPFSVVFPDVALEPGDVITVILRPAPGALPELPGFPDDDELQRIFPFVVPALPPWALATLALALASVGVFGSKADQASSRSEKRRATR